MVELIYNPLDIHSNTTTKWLDIYYPKQIDAQFFGYTSPVIEQGILTFVILDKLIYSFLNISLTIKTQPNKAT